MGSYFTGDKKKAVLLILIVLVLVVCVACGTAKELASKITNLTCEYMADPLGVDVAEPRLSWISFSDEKNQSQSAYRILCSSSLKKLKAGTADLWDSGKVKSDKSVLVKYDGSELKAFAEVFWNVEVWDKNGKSLGVSEPGKWTMGPLANSKWDGKWIKYSSEKKYTKRKADFGNAKWLLAEDADVSNEKPTIFLRKKITVGSKTIKKAIYSVTGGEYFTIYINDQKTANYNLTKQSWKKVRTVDVKKHLEQGDNLVAIQAVGNKKKDAPAMFIALLEVEFEDGSTQKIGSSSDWRVSSEKKDGWFKDGFDDSGWSNAKALGRDESAKLTESLVYPADWDQLRASPLLRKEFEVTKPVRSAYVFISGLGYYEMSLNSQKVGDHKLDPAFTKYDTRALYVTYDVTDSLKSGKNAIGVMLGNGWFNMHTRAEWNFDRSPWRDEPKMILQMNITYQDGTSETVVSDETWKGSAGAVVFDSIRNGEYYDARLEKLGWDGVGFDDSDWGNAQSAKETGVKLSAQIMPAIKVIETIKPVKIAEPEEGVYVFDMGVNFAGWVKLKTSGPAGTKVKMRYSERLNSQGLVDQSGIAVFVFNGPFQTDTYILKGKGIEQWEPRFTYHGFRYVEVTGLAEKPTLETLEGQFASTAFEQIGEFECSNEMFNTIQEITLRAYRSNFYGYPTDCPQREKNGWTGDAHLAAEMGLYNFASAPGYTKWMNDFRDAQYDNGSLPGIVPTSGWGYLIGPGWDSAYFLIPWYMYTYCGDVGILESHYDELKLYIEFLKARAKDNIIEYGLGDWVPAKTKTPTPLVTTAFYYLDNVILAKIAEIVSKPEDAKQYNDLALKVKQSFNKRFYKGDGVYGNGSQTSLLTALYYNLVEDSNRQAVFDKLLEAVQENDYHLDSGIMGTKYLFNVLSEGGKNDVAYRVANQKTFPSYGDWIEKGATTLWEDWKGAASLNHIMFGDISAWFFRNFGSIKPDVNRPGFKHIIIEPQPAGDLKWAKAKYDCPYGEIKSQWEIEGDKFELKVTVPFNTSATVYVPAEGSWAKDNSSKILPGHDSNLIKVTQGNVIFNVGSGTYIFKSKLADSK